MNLGAVLDDGTIVPQRGWIHIETRLDGIAAQRLGLRVILSIASEDDGRPWIHISCSREERIPSWRDVREVKDAWLGDREAYMVFPPAERYVNLNPNVLHLWSPLEKPEGILPHFEAYMASGVATI